MSSKIKVVKLKEEHRQLFSLSPSDWQSNHSYQYSVTDMRYLLCQESCETAHKFLLMSQQKKLKVNIETFKAVVLHRIKKLEEKMAVLERIYTAKQPEFTPREKIFLVSV
jgi:hypothetical protein